MTTIATTNSSIAGAVLGAVKTDVTKALTAAGLGGFAGSQQVTDLTAKIGQDAVSALQSPGSQGAAAALSKVITSDVGSALNQFGMGAYANSGQVADFDKGLAADVLAAAQSAGYGQEAPAAATPSSTAAAPSTPATAAAPTTTTAPTAATLAAVSSSLTTSLAAELKAVGMGSLASSSTMTGLVAQMTKDVGAALQSAGADQASAIGAALTKDVDATMQGMGLGAYTGSSAVTSFVAQMGRDALSAAQASMASQAAAAKAAAPTAAPAQAAAAKVAAPAPAPTPAPAPAAAVAQPATASAAAAPAQPAAAQVAAAATTATAAVSNATSAAAETGVDKTIQSILTSLAPLTATGANLSTVLGKVADGLDRHTAGGDTGAILSSVADKLRQVDASNIAAAKASAASAAASTAASATASKVAASAGSTKATAVAGSAKAAAPAAKASTPSVAQGATLPAAAAVAAPLSATSASQSASATIASVIAQNQTALNAIAAGDSRGSGSAAISLLHPLVLAYAAA